MGLYPIFTDCLPIDMLDDFKDVKIDSQKPENAGSAPVNPLPPNSKSPPTADPSATTKADEEDVLSDDDFAKQLQAGMAELMGEIEGSVL